MIVKSTILAVIFFSCSLGFAAAQTSSPTPLGTSTRGSEAQTSGTGPITSAVVGWNYVHAAACTSFGDTFVFVALDGSTWYTNNIVTIATLTPACQTGNFAAFHVINVNGTWDQIYVWPFK
jgi:hypothetical protein